MITKRGLIFILVVATVTVFISLVWLIATKVPWSQLSYPNPSITAGIAQTERNCTSPVTYWREHPESYPPWIVIGAVEYQAEEIHGILSNDSLDLPRQLQAELVGAFLNTLSGANQSLIESAIFQAYTWLVENPDGNQVADQEREAGSRLYAELEAYNHGLAGVAPCQANATTEIMETSTTSVTPTITPSQTPSPTTSVTPSSTGASTTPLRTVSIASQTPTSTQGLPPLPSNTPIRTTAVPSPTRTPNPSATQIIPTTAAPTATRTLAPSPTDTPSATTEIPTTAPPPAPTSTNTLEPKPTLTPPVPTSTNPPPP